MPSHSRNAPICFLGIEGGATRTVALLADDSGQLVQRIQAGPGNLRLLSDRQLAQLLRFIRASTTQPVAVAIGLAGARNEKDWARIGAAARRIWPGIPCCATNDLETALAAADTTSANNVPCVLVLSGTGSCCYGRTAAGRTVKVGGWGHLLGDRGSAYWIGWRALQVLLEELDRTGRWPRLGQQLLRSLQLNEPDELIAWAQAAGKTDLAALAVEVFAAWRRGEPVASAVLDQAVQQLAIDAARCARRLVGKTMPVRFILAGGVLAQQPRFAQKVGRALRALWSGAEIIVLKGESAWGAVALAQRVYRQHALEQEKAPFKAPGVTARVSHFKSPAAASTIPGGLPEPAKAASDLELVAQSPTEQRHPKSMNLDRLSLAEAIELMLSEDAKIPKAILAERPRIERTIQLIARTLRHGGRLFYVGAGTSGRLGVLDASECPPTFGTSPDQVQGIIAGGQRALWEAVEGAEDDVAAGVRAMSFRGVIRRDVVVGIAASGRTPFVWGALREAKRRRAVTVLLTFNPVLRIRPADRPRQVIALDLGPEILTGSTRLKAGTATKLILNMLTTLAMVRLGKVISNLMVDLSPSNTKLRDRAVRIVEQLTGVGAERARAALARSGWVVKTACRRLRAFRD